MENEYYNRLIYQNKLDELANVSLGNISDLTKYKYRNKYLLEFLLEKGIRTSRMDTYLRNNCLWINLYLKYNIVEPLVNIKLNKLLLLSNDELMLDKVLKVLNNNQKMKLYHNIKKDNYWLFVINETLIIDHYKKYGIELPQFFIKIPTISDDKITTSDTFEKKISDFKNAFSDVDNHTLLTYITELRKKSLINRRRAYIDIDRLIDYKKEYPEFKLSIYKIVSDSEFQGGIYQDDEYIVIDQYHKGIFSHELSHLLYKQYDFSEEDLKEYKRIQKSINNSKIIKRIVLYLEDFHKRYDDMLNVFSKIYLVKVKEQYGSYNNYFNNIYNDIKNIKPEFITIEKKGVIIYLNDDNLKEVTDEIIFSNVYNYTHILTNNYYFEELFLENLFDALLKGRIYEGKYKVDSLSGHSNAYYKESDDLSFNECLANYDAIKSSYRANILISKLRSIVGDELVDFLEDYIKRNRNNKKLIKR